MLKKTLMLSLLFAGFNFGFSEEDSSEPPSTERILNEIEKETEKKVSLNKIFTELSEEQRVALQEEFDEQLAEYQKKIDDLEKQLVDTQIPQE